MHTYIFDGLILMLWHRETHINPQRNRWMIMNPSGVEHTTPRLRQHRQLPAIQHVRFMPLKLCQKHNPNDTPEAALDNWQPVWNAQVSISTLVLIHSELHPCSGNIHICWFDIDALAQGNAYKPIKESINYRGHTDKQADRQADRQYFEWTRHENMPLWTGNRTMSMSELLYEFERSFNTYPLNLRDRYWIRSWALI